VKLIKSILKLDAKSTAINAVTLALMDAGISMKDFMVSSNAGKMNEDFITGFLIENRYHL
jgi:ribonuclease PH